MSTSDSQNRRPPIEINAVLGRVARFVGAQNDAALAEALDTSRQVISGWRKRGTIPYEKLVEFTQSFEDVSLNELLWGEEPLMVEVPVEGNRVSAQKLELIGDALMDAVNKVKAEQGAAYEDFMKGPQIFAYAALVYNRTIDQFPPGQIWIPEVNKEIEHIIEIVKLDFERKMSSTLHRDSSQHGNQNPQRGAGDFKNSTGQKSSSAETREGAYQEIGGDGHQIAGGNIENNGGVHIGKRSKK